LYDEISKNEIIEGTLYKTIDITQSTKFVIKKKIVPDLIPKSAFVRLFKNVQISEDIFASEVHNEYLNEKEFGRLVAAMGILSFKMDEEFDRKFPKNEDKVHAMIKLITE
jgi:hypothetical protein